jgi:hypothetical protein
MVMFKLEGIKAIVDEKRFVVELLARAGDCEGGFGLE